MSSINFSTEQNYDGYLKVNSCGKQQLSERDCDILRPNGRIDYSIYYIAQGKYYCNLDNQICEALEGSAVLYFPGVRQQYTYKGKDNTVMLWSHFSGTACQMLDTLKYSSGVIIPLSDRRQFEFVFEKMILAHYSNSKFSASVSEGYMNVLLALIAQSNEINKGIIGKPRNEKMELVLSHINIYYNHPVDIRKYADMCGVGEDHFIRIFKAYTGLTPYHYQLKIRMDRAKELLESTSITISECCEAVGFHDAAYFSRIFKKMTGHSPSYYK